MEGDIGEVGYPPGDMGRALYEGAGDGLLRVLMPSPLA